MQCDHPSSTWIPCCSGEPLPRGAVHVGTDEGDVGLYVGRAFHSGDLLPAKINPTHAAAYVCWGGKEHAKNEYEVLCFAKVAWKSVVNHEIPPNAVVIGATSKGEKLYMGRGLYDGTLTTGKIQPSHQVLYIPFNGQEMRICSDYEIMIYRTDCS